MGAEVGSNNVEVLEILVLAVLAGFIIFKLWSVLGRRTGHEPTSGSDTTYYRSGNPENTASSTSGNGSDNVVPLPGAGRPPEDTDEVDLGKYASEGSDLSEGLVAIQLADRSFNPEVFLSGAKSAYEMIVTAFADGDRKTLRQLIDKDVFEAFDESLKERQERGETIEFQFVGMNSAKMTEAELVDKVAQITVKFVSEVISATKNADGAIIDGDPTAIRQVTDAWTFQRDTRNSDPNWVLVETAG